MIDQSFEERLEKLRNRIDNGSVEEEIEEPQEGKLMSAATEALPLYTLGEA